LRQSLFSLMKRFQNGPKPIRTQLCVSLAHLALQMTEWKDVLPLVISTFGAKDQASLACILEFLRVLAEEVTEGRKINLTVR
jgi:transportin-3